MSKCRVTHICLFSLTFLILITTQLSCKKDKPSPYPKFCDTLTANVDFLKQHIEGEWEWVRNRVINSRGEVFITTPESEGYIQELIVKDGMASFSRTEKGIREEGLHNYKIGLELEVTLYPSDSTTVFIIRDTATNILANYFRIRMCENNLVLYQTFRSDGLPDIYYVRKQ